MITICKECGSSYNKTGRELVCSVLCKIQSYLDKNSECWVVKKYESAVNPNIRYKDRFYNVRKYLFFNKVSYEKLSVCSKNNRCVFPGHQKEISAKNSILSWADLLKKYIRKGIYGLYK